MIDKNEKINLEAATFRRLVDHLQKNTDLQNLIRMSKQHIFTTFFTFRQDIFQILAFADAYLLNII